MKLWIAFLWFSLIAIAQDPPKDPNQPLADPKKSDKREVGKITAEESEELITRRKSLRFTEFGFGPAWTTTLGTDTLMYGFIVGSHWDVHEHGELTLRATTALGGDFEADYLTLAIGANYFPFTTDFSPAIGAEFGAGLLGGTKIVDDAGFVLGLNAGFRLFRTATTQLEPGFRYFMIIGKDAGVPNVYEFHLSLLF